MPKGWWFPDPISRHAVAFDAQFLRTTIVALLILITAQFALAVVVWRFRARRARASKRPTAPKNTLAEGIGTVATAVLFLGLLAMGGHIWAGVQFSAAPPQAEVVEVLGKQFAWSFRYPGPDGRFGRTDIRLINDAAANPFGLDEKDPAAKDDIVAAVLRVPAGAPVTLLLTSHDVIHSFFVRELRLKQDLVPGMQIPLSFEADVPGTYEVPCAELCGLGHHQMRTTMIVMPVDAYRRWKREQAH